jgi:hypothetical protein
VGDDALCQPHQPGLALPETTVKPDDTSSSSSSSSSTMQRSNVAATAELVAPEPQVEAMLDTPPLDSAPDMGNNGGETPRENTEEKHRGETPRENTKEKHRGTIRRKYVARNVGTRGGTRKASGKYEGEERRVPGKRVTSARLAMGKCQ